MSESTQPPKGGPHSISPASIGARLNLTTGKGDEHAKLLWLVILSRTRWPGRRQQDPWPTDSTLAHDAGIKDERVVRRALQRLRGAGMITTPTGNRPTAKRKHGRLLVPRLSAPVKILIPDRGQMTNLWLTCGEFRERPASLVTLVVGLYALACDAEGRRVTGWTKIHGTAADARRFVGARKGHAWTRRLRDLESIGLLERRGREVWLAPVSRWIQAERAISRALAETKRKAQPRKAAPGDPRWDVADRSWP